MENFLIVIVHHFPSLGKIKEVLEAKECDVLVYFARRDGTYALMMQDIFAHEHEKEIGILKKGCYDGSVCFFSNGPSVANEAELVQLLRKTLGEGVIVKSKEELT